MLVPAMAVRATLTIDLSRAPFAPSVLTMTAFRSVTVPYETSRAAHCTAEACVESCR